MSVDLSSIERQNDFDEVEEIPEDNQIMENNEIIDEEEKQMGIDHRRKILIIQYYLNEFPDKLKGYKNINLESLSDEELDDLRKEMDFVNSQRSSVNMAVQAFVQGVNTIETLCCNFTPLKVQGLTNICNDKDLIDDVKSLVLSNMTLAHIEPEYRILYKLSSSMLLLHNINSNAEEKKKDPIPEKKDNEISLKKQVKLESINQKYEGL